MLATVDLDDALAEARQPGPRASQSSKTS